MTGVTANLEISGVIRQAEMLDAPVVACNGRLSGDVRDHLTNTVELSDRLMYHLFCGE